LLIQHFHELAFDLVSEAGLTSSQPDNRDMSTYFSQTLPELLLDAADQLDLRFDAIVVDEGQDFREEWWVPLQALLSDPDEAVWYIFYDNQQSIYTTGAAPPFSGNPYPLTTNMRSTKAIHDHIKAFYDAPVGCRGPEGRPPQIIQAVNPQDEMKRRLHQLVNEEHVSPADIVILTPASQERSQWKQGQRIGNLTLTWSQPNERLQVPVSTIHSFKGLESPVVILTEMDTISDYQPEDRLRLVAYSRAMSELVVIENAG
jgi:superfamily I DNA and RNA helicase